MSRFSKNFAALFVVLIFGFSSIFAAGYQVNAEQFKKAIEDEKNYSVRYSFNVYLDSLDGSSVSSLPSNIGSVSGVLKEDNNEYQISANLSIASSIDMFVEQFMGSTLSGEYNGYLKLDENGDVRKISKLMYTNKNSNKYIDATENDFISSGLDMETTISSSKEIENNISDFNKYTYKNGKYVTTFNVPIDDETQITIDFMLTFNKSAKLSIIEIQGIIPKISNPLTGDDARLKMNIKGYIFDIGKTVININ